MEREFDKKRPGNAGPSRYWGEWKSRRMENEIRTFLFKFRLAFFSEANIGRVDHRAPVKEFLSSHLVSAKPWIPCFKLII